MMLTKKELANIAGYTYQRLYTIDRDLPNDKKLFVRRGENDKKFDLALFVQRWVEYNRDNAEVSTDKLSQIKAQHEKVKKQKTEIEVERLRGELVRLDEVSAIWADIAGTVRARFVSMARKLAPALVMIDDPDRIEEMIDRDIRDALSLIAETPLPDDTYSCDGRGDDDGEDEA